MWYSENSSCPSSKYRQNTGFLFATCTFPFFKKNCFESYSLLYNTFFCITWLSTWANFCYLFHYTLYYVCIMKVSKLTAIDKRQALSWLPHPHILSSRVGLSYHAARGQTDSYSWCNRNLFFLLKKRNGNTFVLVLSAKSTHLIIHRYLT